MSKDISAPRDSGERNVPAKLNVNTLLSNYKDQIAAALPSHLTAERMARLALTAIRGNDRLAKADALSLMGAIIKAAQDGLEPGRTAHLVPFWSKAAKCYQVQYIADYRGLIALARNSGQIGAFYAEAVRDGDFFEYQRGTEEFLRHRPSPDPIKDRPVLYYYAVARSRDGSWSQFHVMTAGEVDAIRQRSRARDDGPWVTDPEAMGKKTAARQLCKWLPQSPEMQRAVLADELADQGRQNTRSVITGEGWAPGDDPDADPAAASPRLAAPRRKSKAPTEPEQAPAHARPLTADQLDLIRGDLAKSALTDTELCAALGLGCLEDLTVEHHDAVYAWIADPMGADAP